MAKTSPNELWQPLHGQALSFGHSIYHDLMAKVNKAALLPCNKDRFNHELLEEVINEHLDVVVPDRVITKSLSDAADDYDETLKAEQIIHGLSISNT